MLWEAIKWVLQGLVTLGLTMGDFDPNRSCTIMIIRRDTEKPIVTFAHSSLGEASGHVQDLLRRLSTTPVYDFCRELQISTDQVQGVGSVEPLNPEQIWRAFPAAKKRR